MDQNLVVISKSEEIRTSFLESYSLLGYEVSVSEDILELIRDLNILEPDYVIMDIDELARMWKIVAAGLRLAQKKITIILIASAVTLEEANEALILGVSGIIIKPFLPGFHLKRVYDIIHRKLRADGKRVYPRFYTGTIFEGALTVSVEATSKVHTFELVNVSEIGAAIRSTNPEIAPELQPDVAIEDALLRLDNEEFPVAIEVIFRKQGLLGVHFKRIRRGQSNFHRFIQRLSLKAFGISGIKGKW
ncbi:MAG: response regulator [Spirochaetaceae bacterium]|nr:MAG: response regulator [Spirochaetaceae bacterium]